MKISFLGTGCGFPTADRYCASILLDIGGRLYLIDAGAPVVDIFARTAKGNPKRLQRQNVPSL